MILSHLLEYIDVPARCLRDTGNEIRLGVRDEWDYNETLTPHYEDLGALSVKVLLLFDANNCQKVVLVPFVAICQF